MKLLILIFVNIFYIGNIEFYTSGGLVKTSDPFNLHLENVLIDTNSLNVGFYFLTFWNYPEAFLKPNIYVKNFTTIKSGTGPPTLKRPVLGYSGPGNVTLEDIDMSGSTILKSVGSVTLGTVSAFFCLPNDGLTKYINITNLRSSLPDNADRSKINLNMIDFSAISTRINFITIDGFTLDNYKYSEFPALRVLGNSLTSVFTTNSYVNDYQTFNTIYLFKYLSKFSNKSLWKILI